MDRLIPKKVTDLVSNQYKFFIPSFQRGYKWTRSEVFKLMHDIWDFHIHSSRNEGSFYCLQPVVVRPVVSHGETVYHVIDGQQRLTTILILQYAINEYNGQNGDSEFESYTIDYATRGSSTEWLKKIRDKEKMSRNNDYYHIHEAYCEAMKFLESGDIKCEELESCLMNDCRFIWYELEKSEDENDDEVFKEDVKIFNDFNSGKIPLTNAELIKALFLQTRNFEKFKNDNNPVVSEDYRTNIAHEWDAIEHTLEDEKFWNFIYDSSWELTYTTRIEYILDILSGKTINDKDNKSFTFDHYNDLYEKSENDPMRFVDEQWKQIKELVQTLQDWYDDRKYYHYIGFLLMHGQTINDIRKLQKDDNDVPVNKTEFIKRLCDKVRNIVSRFTRNDLFKGGRGLSTVLQLFNILSYMDIPSDTSRFPFHHFKADYTWNEEHVMPNTPFDPSTPSRCFQFAAQMLEYFTDLSYFDRADKSDIKGIAAEYNDRINKMTGPKGEPGKHQAICRELLKIFETRDQKLSEECYNKLCEEFETSNNPLSNEEDSDERNFIWNIVLLDESTKKSYGNAIFPYKRKRILRNENKGIFVPLCTSNVFLKTYSTQMDNMFQWDKNDAINYLAAIINRLYYTKGRKFLNPDFAECNDMPEFVDKEYLKKLVEDNG